MLCTGRALIRNASVLDLLFAECADGGGQVCGLTNSKSGVAWVVSKKTTKDMRGARVEQSIGSARLSELRKDDFAGRDDLSDQNGDQRIAAASSGMADPRADVDAEVAAAMVDPSLSADTSLSNVTALPSADRRERLRILEALLFAAAEPLHEKQMAEHLPDGDDVMALLAELQGFYAGRGVNLVRVAGKWAFRTAEDLAFLLERHAKQQRRLSKAALETLSIIAYHQPVTRAEIEEIRGVQTSSGTLDVLMETGWVRPRGRRRAPGRPITYGTTPEFLVHFSLDSIKDLPGLAELKGAGLLDSNLPPGFEVPEPRDVAALMPDELPLEQEEEETAELPFGGFDGDDDDDAAAAGHDAAAAEDRDAADGATMVNGRAATPAEGEGA